jgi:hypothetical protein
MVCDINTIATMITVYSVCSEILKLILYNIKIKYEKLDSTLYLYEVINYVMF